MRLYILIPSLLFIVLIANSQTSSTTTFEKDSVLIIPKNVAKGFYHEYILFIPQGTAKNKTHYLLVEPNNTGEISDDINIHKTHALALATKSGIGNNIATMLKLPLLIPIFPRPAEKPLTYTHALDRDVMLESTPELKRLDLQLLHMIDDANHRLAALELFIAPKILMSGFSASATFTNRFSTIHPEKIKALAIGGFNGKLIIPYDKWDAHQLNYPLGLNDFKTIFNKDFNALQFQKIPMFIYMGALDENDAVQFDDAYDQDERELINQNIGNTVQKRFQNCLEIYTKLNPNIQTKRYEDVGHWTTAAINLEIITFFYHQIQ